MAIPSIRLAIDNDDNAPLLAGAFGSSRFEIFDGTDVPDCLGAEYARLGYGALARAPAMLRHFDFARILRSLNLLVFISCDHQLLAAAYVELEMRDDRRVLIHKGYVSSGRQRGLAKVMIAALHLGDAYRSGASADGEAVARILPDGLINEASSIPFSDAGFHGVGNYPAKIGPSDIHLAPYAKKRPEGLVVGSHLMAGKAARIAARAEDILADWKLTWRAPPPARPWGPRY